MNLEALPPYRFSFVMALGLVAVPACTAGQQLGDPPSQSDAGDANLHDTDGGPGSTSSSQPGDGNNSRPGETNTADAGPPPGAKRFFVTSAAHDGAMGGAAGVDQRCTVAAQGANLGGAWKAVIAGASLNDVGPWYLLDGTKIFLNLANLQGGTPLVAPMITEQNRQLPFGERVWTGQPIDAAGQANTTCTAWTVNTEYTLGGPVGTVGDSWRTTDEWQTDSQDRYAACSEKAHLYCIEQ